MNIFVLVRAITYATLFIGFLLVYVPGLLLGSGNARPVVIEAPQIAGMILAPALHALLIIVIPKYDGQDRRSISMSRPQFCARICARMNPVLLAL
jgi:hypothetical protein